MTITDGSGSDLLRARSGHQELDAAKQDASSFQDSVKGLLRVTLRISTGTTMFLPALPAFLGRYPGLMIDVSLTDERLDLVASDRCGCVTGPSG
jgi:DNA-binding transcriptional LysR family regulator